ncbi:hypothetical protein ACFLWH_02050 [Chloroflexota bacterium]
MVDEAPFLLQVEDEGPDLGGADAGGVGGQAFGGKEIIQVADTAGHGVDGSGAFAFGSGAEPVAGGQGGQERGIGKSRDPLLTGWKIWGKIDTI